MSHLNVSPKAKDSMAAKVILLILLPELELSVRQTN